MRTYPPPKRMYVTFDPKANYRRLVKEHVAFITSLKEGKTCADCSGEFPPACMEFDHVLPGKTRSIALMRNWSKDKILAEVALCELVCCNCHRVRTASRRATTYTYKNSSMLKRLLAFRAWMQVLKAAACTDCGEHFPAVAMDFDHVRGEKVIAISQMWGWSRARVLVELEKCELVCANDHRLRTVNRLQRAAA